MTDLLDNVKDDKADTLFSAHKRTQKLSFILKIKRLIVLEMLLYKFWGNGIVFFFFFYVLEWSKASRVTETLV